ncbi:MAG: FAD-dependent oxidoreductase [Cyanobacteria bacterium J06638_7]
MTAPAAAASTAAHPRFDLLVIGAGASGASIAFEAARRGLSVALVEGRDIASGTSSRSTKLLHGGVRYLELAFRRFDRRQLLLVREALAERGHWLEAAPFLARPLELLLPTRQPLAKLYYGAGLALYDALAGRSSIGASRCVPSAEVQRRLPQLAPGHGGVAYSDGQFDDARLNLLLVRSAVALGVRLWTRAPVVELLRDAAGQLNGAVLQQNDGSTLRLQAGVVLNATGIGADAIRRLAQADAAPRLQVSRGAHLVLEADLCPGGTGLLVPSTDDGRVLFVLPFYGLTLVGTTDSACPREAAECPSAAEEAYLLDYVRRWFPAHGEPVVASRWAGGRPLLLPEGGGAGGTAGIVREHTVETLPCGLVSLMGGKWTTCRPMALDALAAAAEQLGCPLPAPLGATPIHGAAADAASTRRQLAALEQRLGERHPPALVAHLLASHGLAAEAVLACAAGPADLEPLSAVIPLTAAEVRHAARHEWARDPADVLERRCRLGFVDRAEAERLHDPVQELLQQELQGAAPARS